MLSASKLYHSASTSGPSATSYPIATNTSASLSAIIETGWRAPGGVRSAGSVTSTRSVTRTCSSRSRSSCSWRSLTALATRATAAPTRRPASARACGGSAPISARARRQRRLVAGVREARLLELVEILRRVDGGERLGDRALDLIRCQRGHLNRVVVLIWCGHLSLPCGFWRLAGPRWHRGSKAVIPNGPWRLASSTPNPTGWWRNRSSRPLRHSTLPTLPAWSTESPRPPASRPGGVTAAQAMGVPAGTVNRNSAPPPGARPHDDVAAERLDQALDDVEAKAGAAAALAPPELAEHPGRHLRGDALPLVAHGHGDRARADRRRSRARCPP